MENTRPKIYESLPAFLILALLAIAPFAGGRDGLVGTGLLSILAFASLAVLVWKQEFYKHAAFWPLIVFVGFLSASYLITASKHATIETTLYFTACVSSAIVASSEFRKSEWFNRIPSVIAIAGVILGILAVHEHIVSGSDWRVFGTFSSPGFFGGYLVLTIPITLAAFLSEKSLPLKGTILVSFGFQLAAVLLTGTRFAVASVLLSFVVIFALMVWKKLLSKKLVMQLGLAVLVTLACFAYARAPISARVSGPQAAEQSHSGPFRVATWKGTLNIIKAHPLTGTGAGTFDLVFPKYMVAGYTRMAHNGYLQIASEAGIPALLAAAVAFFMLFGSGLKGAMNRQKDNEALELISYGIAAALIGSLARNLLDSDLYNTAIGLTFWALAGVLASRSLDVKQVSIKPVRATLTAVLVLASAVSYMMVLGQLNADSAMDALRNGEPEKAIELYQSAIKLDSLRADYWLTLGQIQTIDNNEWAEGISNITHASNLEPTRAKHQIVLAKAYLAQGENNAALTAFQRALVLDPHATPAMVESAKLLEGKAQEEMYARLIKEETSPTETLKGVPEIVNPDYIWGHLYFGQKNLKEGNWDQSAKQFESVIDRLERRESFKMYREAQEASDMVDPEQEKALASALKEAKAGLAVARGHIK